MDLYHEQQSLSMRTVRLSSILAMLHCSTVVVVISSEAGQPPLFPSTCPEMYLRLDSQAHQF